MIRRKAFQTCTLPRARRPPGGRLPPGRQGSLDGSARAQERSFLACERPCPGESLPIPSNRASILTSAAAVVPGSSANVARSAHLAQDPVSWSELAAGDLHGPSAILERESLREGLRVKATDVRLEVAWMPIHREDVRAERDVFTIGGLEGIAQIDLVP